FMSTFNSQYASAGASGLNVGVVGGQNGQGGLTGVGNDVFTTTLRIGNFNSLGLGTPGTESAPIPNPTKATISNAGGIAGGFAGYGNNLSVSDPGSFTSQIAKDPASAGTAVNSFVSLLGGDNPLQAMTGSLIFLDLWKDTVTTSTTTSGWVYQGAFMLDLSGAAPLLVWDPIIPEPSTYGLLSGIGVLALALWKQLHRKSTDASRFPSPKTHG